MNRILFGKTRDVKTPTRGTSKSAGIDLYIPEKLFAGGECTILPGQALKIPSGLKVRVPENHALIVFNKSGIALKGLQVGACVIDEDYQGEIHLHVTNTSLNPVSVTNGQKLVQVLLIPIAYAEIVDFPAECLHSKKSERGSGGFGSTGL
tara:strand:+ start:2623 stop:3072 length:450 start_codon:yes stop_codon:yes gene_type:complete